MQNQLSGRDSQADSMMSKLASANTKAVMNARKNMMNTSNNVSVISAKKSEIMNTS